MTQFKKGALEICVLSLLSKKDCYGYEIVELISRKIEVSEGTIYPLLRRLTKEGHFETYLKESSEGPTRKYYRLTKGGEERCRILINQWEKFIEDMQSILNISFEEGES